MGAVALSARLPGVHQSETAPEPWGLDGEGAGHF